MSALDTLRARARKERVFSENETNERYEETPRPRQSAPASNEVISSNSFVSLPQRVGTETPKAHTALIREDACAPRTWAEAYALLCTMSAPAGFLQVRWNRIIDAADRFLDRWGAEAIRCGWSDLDAFGCHSGAPTARFDCMGLVMLLDRCEVTAIDRDGADLVTVTGARQRFRRRPLPPGTVSLWELARR